MSSTPARALRERWSGRYGGLVVLPIVLTLFVINHVRDQSAVERLPALTLKYRLSEKVATPTSVVLMAFNAILGFALHALILQHMQMEAYRFWWISIPVVGLGRRWGPRS